MVVCLPKDTNSCLPIIVKRQELISPLSDPKTRKKAIVDDILSRDVSWLVSTDSPQRIPIILFTQRIVIYEPLDINDWANHELSVGHPNVDSSLQI